MNITRRDALLGATAAAAVTGLAVAPLAIKAAAVKAALAGDPVRPAFEAFEVLRREYLAADIRVDAAYAVVTAEMPPEPDEEPDAPGLRRRFIADRQAPPRDGRYIDQDGRECRVLDPSRYDATKDQEELRKVKRQVNALVARKRTCVKA